MGFPIKTDIYQISKLDEYLFHVHYFSGELQLEDYLSSLKFLMEFRKHHDSVYILTSQDSHFYFSKETWNYLKKEYRQFSIITAQAIVLKELHLRLLAKFYLRLVKKVNKTKIFSSKVPRMETSRMILVSIKILSLIEKNKYSIARIPII